jgi:Fe-S cluster biosynthesis and repair protein YggX
MPDVTCRRCGQHKAGLDRPPLPGRWGLTVQHQTCADCWLDWIEEQTRLINHEGLTPAQPAHRQVLYERLEAFLRLHLDQT